MSSHGCSGFLNPKQEGYYCRLMEKLIQTLQTRLLDFYTNFLPYITHLVNHIMWNGIEFIKGMMGGAEDAIDDAREEARLNALRDELREQSKDLKEHTSEIGEKTVTAVNSHTSDVISQAMGEMKQSASLELQLAMERQLREETEKENETFREALQAITTPRHSRRRTFGKGGGWPVGARRGLSPHLMSK